MTSFSRFAVLLALLAAVMALPAKATAGSVVITDYNLGNPDFSGNAGLGGPFAAHTTSGELGVADFVTFCLEFNEDFTPGQTYTYVLSDSAKNGGVAGGNPDPLSDATKWLYYEVATGLYASTYSTATGLGLSNNVGADFQNAIWYLEEERTAADIGGVSGAGYSLANYALLNHNWSSLAALGNNVYAMNITDANGGRHQDQLAYTFDPQQSAVPEPASLTLLGTGLLVAFRAIRKRAVVASK